MEMLFVYGTLKKDDKSRMHEFLMDRSAFIGNGRVPGLMVEGTEFPAVRADDKHWVDGEVYMLNNAETTMREIDNYEGCGSNDSAPYEYARKKVIANMDDGTHTEVWVYYYLK